MNTSQLYIVQINAPEGLETPRGEHHKEMAQRNSEAITGNFDAQLAQLESAGVLDGITVQARMRFISALTIEGSEEKVQLLKHYLENNKIGSLCENFELRAVQ